MPQVRYYRRYVAATRGRGNEASGKVLYYSAQCTGWFCCFWQNCARTFGGALSSELPWLLVGGSLSAVELTSWELIPHTLPFLHNLTLGGAGSAGGDRHRIATRHWVRYQLRPLRQALGLAAKGQNGGVG